MAGLVVTPLVMSGRVERVAFSALSDEEIDEIIDVRSPGEHAIDHVFGALNLPVLDDDERVRVGTLHRQRGPFDARRLGAGLVASNIARHMAEHFVCREKHYRPLVYCWRGGQRSRSLATVLSEVGWCPLILEGGYKAYRRHVIEILETAGSFRWKVLNGFTGAGKTLVLQALRERGGQVLDLEGLANHKGSLFGGDWDQPQPKQKRFESLIRDAMIRFDPERPVFVEAESPKIGHLNVPAPLWRVMRDSTVIEINTTIEARRDYLNGDYAGWIAEPDRILGTIDRLQPFHSHGQVEAWRRQCREGAWPELIESLLREHYDRRYGVAGSGHYAMAGETYDLENHGESAIGACADWLLEREDR